MLIFMPSHQGAAHFNTVPYCLTWAAANHFDRLLRHRWVNITCLELSSCRSSKYMAIQWHSAPLPLTSVYKYGCGRGGCFAFAEQVGAFEVDWAWWMLIDDTVCPELHNELVSQVFHTSANRVWLLPFVLYSCVYVYAPLNLHLNCWRNLSPLVLFWMLLS